MNPIACRYHFLVPLAHSLVLVSLIGCGVNVIVHDPDQATKSAIKFVQVVLIDQDLETGYELWSEQTKEEVSPQAFMVGMTQVHPRGFPKKVMIHEYQPMPDQEAMLVFAEGASEDELFFYRIIMSGTARKGYKVQSVFRDRFPAERAASRDSVPSRLYAL